MRLFTLLKGMLLRMNLVADYIVERGEFVQSSSSTWRWTKWASGEIEVENRWTNVSFYLSAAYGSAYYEQFTRSVLSEVPMLTGTLKDAKIEFIGGAGLMAANVTAINASTNSISYYAWNFASGNITKHIIFTFTGRWK